MKDFSASRKRFLHKTCRRIFQALKNNVVSLDTKVIEIIVRNHYSRVMVKLRIKNCGPILEGFDSFDGFMNLKKYTLLVGDQGTGKSTVAKLISICSWLEKAFFRGDYDPDTFNANDFKELYSNQLLSDYFSQNTELDYIGEAYSFSYHNNVFSTYINNNTLHAYSRPKIMYVPSERNLLSIIKNVDELDNLPPMLRLLRVRYLQANDVLQKDGKYCLPLPGYKILVNRTTGETFVQDSKTEKSVPLMCASSGLQSIVPSSLVTEHLAVQSARSTLDKIRSLTRKDLESLKKTVANEVVNSELDRYIMSGIAKSVTSDSLILLQEAARKFTNDFFLNIVEEPEQNLFPDSQMRNIDFLINASKLNEGNKLVMTTHSPYILSYITLAAKAFELSKREIPDEEIEKIVPKTSWLDGNQCIVYQLKDGMIRKLPVYGRGLPSDNNMLNETLGNSNDKFDTLLDLEEQFEN